MDPVAGSLIEYGVLGVVLFLFWGFINRLISRVEKNNDFLESQVTRLTSLIDEKDKQLEENTARSIDIAEKSLQGMAKVYKVLDEEFKEIKQREMIRFYKEKLRDAEGGEK